LGLGFRIKGLGFKVKGISLRSGVWNLGFGV
jgi:hypothetical protein